jgi:hypothetical protein
MEEYSGFSFFSVDLGPIINLFLHTSSSHAWVCPLMFLQISENQTCPRRFPDTLPKVYSGNLLCKKKAKRRKLPRSFDNPENREIPID